MLLTWTFSCSALDSARTAISTALLAAWEGRGAVEALRNRFVTGDWEEGRKRAEATPGEEDDEDGAGEVGQRVCSWVGMGWKEIAR